MLWCFLERKVPRSHILLNCPKSCPFLSLCLLLTSLSFNHCYFQHFCVSTKHRGRWIEPIRKEKDYFPTHNRLVWRQHCTNTWFTRSILHWYGSVFPKAIRLVVTGKAPYLNEHHWCCPEFDRSGYTVLTRNIASYSREDGRGSAAVRNSPRISETQQGKSLTLVQTQAQKRMAGALFISGTQGPCLMEDPSHRVSPRSHRQGKALNHQALPLHLPLEASFLFTFSWPKWVTCLSLTSRGGQVSTLEGGERNI